MFPPRIANQTATNGREAIEQAVALQPDIILMDASMPVLDGWQATRALKQNPTTKHIPILALTAHAFADAQQKARDVGCDGFVTKPCLPDELVTRVRAVLGPTITAATATNVWQNLTVSGVAIAGTAFARIVLITGDFLPGGQGGAPRFDDASFESVVPVPAAVWLFGSALGLMGVARRKVAA